MGAQTASNTPKTAIFKTKSAAALVLIAGAAIKIRVVWTCARQANRTPVRPAASSRSKRLARVSSFLALVTQCSTRRWWLVSAFRPQPLHLRDVDHTPDRRSPPRREPNQVSALVHPPPRSVDPAHTKRLIHRLRVSHAGTAGGYFVQAHQQFGALAAWDCNQV